MSEKPPTAAETMQSIGMSLVGCGCLITLLPVVLVIIFVVGALISG